MICCFKRLLGVRGDEQLLVLVAAELKKRKTEAVILVNGKSVRNDDLLEDNMRSALFSEREE